MSWCGRVNLGWAASLVGADVRCCSYVHAGVIAPSPIYLPLYLPTEANAVHTHTSAPYSSVHQLLLREAALNCTVCADWASRGGGYRIKAIATSTVTKWLFCLWLWSLPICYKLNHDSMKKSLTDTGNKKHFIFNIFSLFFAHISPFLIFDLLHILTLLIYF